MAKEKEKPTEEGAAGAGGKDDLKTCVELLKKHGVPVNQDVSPEEFVNHLAQVLTVLDQILEPEGEEPAAEPEAEKPSEEVPTSVSMSVDQDPKFVAMRETLSKERLEKLIGKIDGLARSKRITPARAKGWKESLTTNSLSLADQEPALAVASILEALKVIEEDYTHEGLFGEDGKPANMSVSEVTSPEWDTGAKELTGEAAAKAADDFLARRGHVSKK